MDVSVLLWGVVFSSVGLGFFLYGKKQKKRVPLICGLLLMLMPYFVYNLWMLTLVSLILMAVPYFIRR